MMSEKQVYDTILNFAKMDERIRMVTLEGSRTNINIPPDDFQDYDITFFVTDMQSFINDDNWLNVFGERLILQKPEDMELFPAEEKGFSYLMLFTDDVKIDLTLLPLDLIDEYFRNFFVNQAITLGILGIKKKIIKILIQSKRQFGEHGKRNLCLCGFNVTDMVI